MGKRSRKIEFHNFSSKAEAEKSRKNVSKRRGKTSKIKTTPANKKKGTKRSYGYKIVKG